MSQASSSNPSGKDASRRNFLKIGAGVVAGAAIASVVEIPYYSSVIGGNNNNSSSTVSSLQDQLQTTQSQLSDTQSSLSATQNSLNAAQGTISSLNNQLSTTQSQLGSVNSQLGSAQSALDAANSANTSLNQQLSTTQGYLSTANQAISTLETQVNNANSQATSAQAQATSLQTQLDEVTGFTTLSISEAAVLEAALEAIVPSDSSGPGAKEAAAINFIDQQLSGEYGNSGNMYMQGPYIATGVSSPITVDGITYSAGSPTVPLSAGERFQYGLTMREFWRIGLSALETYSNSAYGGNFETLTAANQLKALQDVWGNKPTSFGGLVPADFAYELTFMAWCGFTLDPIHGGNKGMVGWTYTGFNGVNFGNFYGEGQLQKNLMLMTTPVRLMPASLAQYQKGSP